MKLLPHEVEFHPSSIVDPHGKLFTWRRELFRAIAPKSTDVLLQVLNNPAIKIMIADGLIVQTELTDLRMDGYGCILKHKRIPVVSYPYEWCFQALKDSALLVIEIQRQLRNCGLTLLDAHPWNVLFDRGQPIYVDFCSIMPADPDRAWNAIDEFYNFFVHPLLLIQEGRPHVARQLLLDFLHGVTRADLRSRSDAHTIMQDLKQSLAPLLKTRLGFQLNLLRKRVSLSIRNQPSLAATSVLQELKRQIEDLALSEQRTEWSAYYEEFPSFEEQTDWTLKQKSVHDIILHSKPNSILDMACNRGWYSHLAARLGVQVICFDTDELSVNRLYCQVKADSSEIYPLIMNVLNPSPGLGLRGGTFPAAERRLKCEMVLALALVHHLVFKAHFTFEYIVASLDAFTEKILVVEFIPKEDVFVREWWTPEKEWYSADTFETTLRQYFNSIEILPSDPEPRIIFVCQK